MATIGNTVGILEKALGAAGLRHRVIANNIANANTPDYQAAGVQFESLLAEALRDPGSALVGLRTDPRHLPIGEPANPLSVSPVVGPSGGAVRVDGNTVDPEHEMALLAANQIWYSALVRSVSDQLQRYRVAITEGRR